ncbi:hypothetical protein Btru_001385 [Bulinus truncatus]|nr:hypothetical protein Btru_001385 [Bulinus truncatus]
MQIEEICLRSRSTQVPTSARCSNTAQPVGDATKSGRTTRDISEIKHLGTSAVMNFSTSHFNPSSYMLNNMPGVRRPELSSMTRPSYSINDLPTLSSRYVDELRSFNVKDYLPCPKDKLDVKLNYSYSDDFNSNLARDPQSARPGGNYSPNTYQPTSTCQLTSTYQPTSTCQLTSTYQPTSTCQLTSACQPTSMCNLSTCHTECRPTSCQPTSSTTSYRPSSMAVRRTLSSIEDRERGGNSKKQKTATGKNGKNPDLNNNFFKDARGKFGAVPERWADCQVYNRIEELARPKQLPCEYKDNRRSVYWMTRKPPPKGEGCNHTHFETSCRLDELAVPKVVCGEFCGTRHCCWECEYPQPPLSCIDPRSVDWNRLACPKKKYPPNGEEIQCVKRAALKAKCSKRIARLSAPVMREAKNQIKALPTKRVCKLSEPKKVIDSDKFYLWLWRKKTDDEVILKKIRRLSIDKCDLSDIRVMIRLELSCTATEESCRKLKATIPTIKFALEKGAQSVVIICAYGTLNGKTDPEFSLQPLTEIFEKHLDRPVIYLEDCVGYQKEGAPRKRKSGKGKDKDPNRPKRPQSAYFIWLNEHREQIKEENPGISITDLSKRAGEMWKEVTDKSEWDEKAKEAKAEYQKAMEEYNKNKPSDSEGEEEDQTCQIKTSEKETLVVQVEVVVSRARNTSPARVATLAVLKADKPLKKIAKKSKKSESPAKSEQESEKSAKGSDSEEEKKPASPASASPASSAKEDSAGHLNVSWMKNCDANWQTELFVPEGNENVQICWHFLTAHLIIWSLPIICSQE